jgi:hypothetical protein
MITIDQLRALNGIPHYMGLGVVKYPFCKNQSYHFYSDRAKILVEDIHEHRFSFTSRVLKGKLKNYIYEIDGTDPTSTLRVERKECAPDSQQEILLSNINLIERCTFITEPNQEYRMHYTTLHKIECLTTKVITHIYKELPFAQTTPRFIADETKPSVCAFSEPKTVNECWDIIEYTLS